jgi:hypothetical protein
VTPGQVDTAIEYLQQIADCVEALAAAVERISQVLEQQQQEGQR